MHYHILEDLIIRNNIIYINVLEYVIPNLNYSYLLSIFLSIPIEEVLSKNKKIVFVSLS